MFLTHGSRMRFEECLSGLKGPKKYFLKKFLGRQKSSRSFRNLRKPKEKQKYFLEQPFKLGIAYNQKPFLHGTDYLKSFSKPIESFDFTYPDESYLD